MKLSFWTGIMVVGAVAALGFTDPFSGPLSPAQRVRDARLSGGRTAELWIVNFDVADAAEEYLNAHGHMPVGLASLKPFMREDTYQFLVAPGNSVKWRVKRPFGVVDTESPIPVEVEVFSGEDHVWESYLLRRDELPAIIGKARPH